MPAVWESETYLRMAVDADAAPMLAVSLDGVVAWANAGVVEMLGVAAARLVGLPLADVTDEAGSALVASWCAQVGTGPVAWSADLNLLDVQRHVLVVEVRMSVLADPSGRPAFLFGTVRDVTGERATARALKSQTAALEMIAGGARLGEILQALCDGVEERIPGALCSILLMDADGLRLVSGAASSLPAAYNAVISGSEIGPAAGSCGTAAYLREEVVVTDVRTDPRWRIFRDLAAEHGIRASWSVPILSSGRVGEAGEVLGTFGIYFAESRAPRPAERLVTQRTAALAAIALERDRVESELLRSSVTDPLTGLSNRTHFLQAIIEALARGSRRRSTVAVLFVDIDHFKVVNDSLGHDAGDQVLCELAARTRAVMRPGDLIARFGGDEFTVLCEDLQAASEAEEIGARLQAALREPLLVGGRELFLSASIGIALGSAGSDAEELVGDADAAMYRAKAAGRSTVVRFDEDMRAQSRTRLQIQTALQRAVEKDELTVCYQPLVDLRTGRIEGVEALTRWVSPELGAVSPAEFIPVAEEGDLITVLGSWVLGEACAQVRRWQQTLSWSPTMSVNVSPRQFGQPGFFDSVVHALADSELDPALLCIEVTETTLGDPARTGQLANRLDELGVSLSIDDFGTGYSSLARIRSFPVHEIKIDRSFVAGLGTSSEDEAVVAAITGMAHALGIQTVAEGIETEVQLRRARELGCTHGQGYLLAAPASADEVTGYLRRRPLSTWGASSPSATVDLTSSAAPRAVLPAGPLA